MAFADRDTRPTEAGGCCSIVAKNRRNLIAESDRDSSSSLHELFHERTSERANERASERVRWYSISRRHSRRFTSCWSVEGARSLDEDDGTQSVCVRSVRVVGRGQWRVVVVVVGCTVYIDRSQRCTVECFRGECSRDSRCCTVW